MVYGKGLKHNVNLGTRTSLADIGQTVADFFGLKKLKIGKSFMPEIVK
jgi:phosphopentomutase